MPGLFVFVGLVWLAGLSNLRSGCTPSPSGISGLLPWVRRVEAAASSGSGPGSTPCARTSSAVWTSPRTGSGWLSAPFGLSFFVGRGRGGIDSGREGPCRSVESIKGNLGFEGSLIFETPFLDGGASEERAFGFRSLKGSKGESTVLGAPLCQNTRFGEFTMPNNHLNQDHTHAGVSAKVPAPLNILLVPQNCRSPVSVASSLYGFWRYGCLSATCM